MFRCWIILVFFLTWTTFAVFASVTMSSLNSVSISSNLCESAGSCFRMSSEPMKMDSRWDQVRWTSNQSEITVSTTESFFCQEEISSRKNPMYLEVIMF